MLLVLLSVYGRSRCVDPTCTNPVLLQEDKINNTVPLASDKSSFFCQSELQVYLGSMVHSAIKSRTENRFMCCSPFSFTCLSVARLNSGLFVTIVQEADMQLVQLIAAAEDAGVDMGLGGGRGFGSGRSLAQDTIDYDEFRQPDVNGDNVISKSEVKIGEIFVFFCFYVFVTRYTKGRVPHHQQASG